MEGVSDRVVAFTHSRAHGTGVDLFTDRCVRVCVCVCVCIEGVSNQIHDVMCNAYALHRTPRFLFCSVLCSALFSLLPTLSLSSPLAPPSLYLPDSAEDHTIEQTRAQLVTLEPLMLC